MTRESSSKSEQQSTTRFSNRVANYVRYRPGYPEAMMRTLSEEFQVGPPEVVADIGAGTGISTKLFLDLGCRTVAVEPNDEMRRVAEVELADNPRFQARAGTAEATTLASQSIDCVAVGQAFHWFDQDAGGAEFRRILKSTGIVALFWNTRLIDTSPFLKAYEDLLQAYGTDYNQVNHQHLGEEAIDTFLRGGFVVRKFPNQQDFDYQGLQGRLLSSSYVPNVGHPKYNDMLAALRDAFDDHQTDGLVAFEYETELYVGRMD